MKNTIGILDIETGGFSTTKNGICEIALLIVSEDLTEILNEFSVLIKPYTRGDDTEELVSYKDDAMAINGITVEELESQGLDVSTACELFLDVLQQNNVKSLMGHNINSFDIPKIDHLTTRFLNKELKGFPTICTLKLSRENLNSKSNKLEDLCSEYSIEQKESHRALSDCYSTLGLALVLKQNGVLIG